VGLASTRSRTGTLLARCAGSDALNLSPARGVAIAAEFGHRRRSRLTDLQVMFLYPRTHLRRHRSPCCEPSDPNTLLRQAYSESALLAAMHPGRCVDVEGRHRVDGMVALGGRARDVGETRPGYGGRNLIQEERHGAGSHPRAQRA
jgi:hypothetical protein